MACTSISSLTNATFEEKNMSGHGFHVHGPHDHELEHATQGHGDNHTSSIAMFTAIIATVGALFGYMGGATQANAGLYKNNAAIKKTEASNQWNYYQAKSSKQNLSELAMELTPAKKAFYQDEIKRYKAEKSDIKVAAEKLEAESQHWDEQSDEQMHLHHRWAQATTVLQVAIAMAAIALLSRKKWLEYVMYAAGSLGVVVGGLAAFHI
jgi:Na+/glutamate symporter